MERVMPFQQKQQVQQQQQQQEDGMSLAEAKSLLQRVLQQPGSTVEQSLLTRLVGLLASLRDVELEDACIVDLLLKIANEYGSIPRPQLKQQSLLKELFLPESPLDDLVNLRSVLEGRRKRPSKKKRRKLVPSCTPPWVVRLVALLGRMAILVEGEETKVAQWNNVESMVQQWIKESFSKRVVWMQPYQVDIGLALCALDVLDSQLEVDDGITVQGISPTQIEPDDGISVQGISPCQVAEKLQNGLCIPAFETASGLPTEPLVTHFVEILLSYATHCQDEEAYRATVRACAKLIKLASPQSLEFSLNQLVKNAQESSSSSSTAGQKRKRSIESDSLSRKGRILSPGYPFIVRLQVMLMNDDRNSAIDLAQMMECCSALSDEDKEIAWRNVFDDLQQAGLIFLDGNVKSMAYVEKRSLLMNLRTRVGQVGWETLIDFYKDLMEAATNHFDAKVSLYVTLASQHTVLQLFRSKFGDSGIQRTLKEIPSLCTWGGDPIKWATTFLLQTNPIPPVLLDDDGKLDLRPLWQVEQEPASPTQVQPQVEMIDDEAYHSAQEEPYEEIVIDDDDAAQEAEIEEQVEQEKQAKEAVQEEEEAEREYIAEEQEEPEAEDDYVAEERQVDEGDYYEEQVEHEGDFYEEQVDEEEYESEQEVEQQPVEQEESEIVEILDSSDEEEPGAVAAEQQGAPYHESSEEEEQMRGEKDDASYDSLEYRGSEAVDRERYEAEDRGGAHESEEETESEDGYHGEMQRQHENSSDDGLQEEEQIACRQQPHDSSDDEYQQEDGVQQQQQQQPQDSSDDAYEQVQGVAQRQQEEDSSDDEIVVIDDDDEDEQTAEAHMKGYEPDTAGQTEEEVSEAVHTEEEEVRCEQVLPKASPRPKVLGSDFRATTFSDMDAADEKEDESSDVDARARREYTIPTSRTTDSEASAALFALANTAQQRDVEQSSPFQRPADRPPAQQVVDKVPAFQQGEDANAAAADGVKVDDNATTDSIAPSEGVEEDDSLVRGEEDGTEQAPVVDKVPVVEDAQDVGDDTSAAMASTEAGRYLSEANTEVVSRTEGFEAAPQDRSLVTEAAAKSGGNKEDDSAIGMMAEKGTEASESVRSRADRTGYEADTEAKDSARPVAENVPAGYVADSEMKTRQEKSSSTIVTGAQTPGYEADVEENRSKVHRSPSKPSDDVRQETSVKPAGSPKRPTVGEVASSPDNAQVEIPPAEPLEDVDETMVDAEKVSPAKSPTQREETIAPSSPYDAQVEQSVADVENIVQVAAEEADERVLPESPSKLRTDEQQPLADDHPGDGALAAGESEVVTQVETGTAMMETGSPQSSSEESKLESPSPKKLGEVGTGVAAGMSSEFNGASSPATGVSTPMSKTASPVLQSSVTKGQGSADEDMTASLEPMEEDQEEEETTRATTSRPSMEHEEEDSKSKIMADDTNDAGNEVKEGTSVDENEASPAPSMGSPASSTHSNIEENEASSVATPMGSPASSTHSSTKEEMKASPAPSVGSPAAHTRSHDAETEAAVAPDALMGSPASPTRSNMEENEASPAPSVGSPAAHTRSHDADVNEAVAPVGLMGSPASPTRSNIEENEASATPMGSPAAHTRSHDVEEKKDATSASPAQSEAEEKEVSPVPEAMGSPAAHTRSHDVLEKKNATSPAKPKDSPASPAQSDAEEKKASPVPETMGSPAAHTRSHDHTEEVAETNEEASRTSRRSTRRQTRQAVVADSPARHTRSHDSAMDDDSKASGRLTRASRRQRSKTDDDGDSGSTRQRRSTRIRRKKAEEDEDESTETPVTAVGDTPSRHTRSHDSTKGSASRASTVKSPRRKPRVDSETRLSLESNPEGRSISFPEDDNDDGSVSTVSTVGSSSVVSRRRRTTRSTAAARALSAVPEDDSAASPGTATSRRTRSSTSKEDEEDDMSAVQEEEESTATRITRQTRSRKVKKEEDASEASPPKRRKTRMSSAAATKEEASEASPPKRRATRKSAAASVASKEESEASLPKRRRTRKSAAASVASKDESEASPPKRRRTRQISEGKEEESKASPPKRRTTRKSAATRSKESEESPPKRRSTRKTSAASVASGASTSTRATRRSTRSTRSSSRR